MKSITSFSFLSILLFILTGTILSGCGGSSGSGSEGASEDITEIKEEIIRKFKYPIPSSFEVVDMLQNADAGFVLGITNSADNVDKYFTQRSKALNLGIYGADLSYVTTYNRQDETMSFLESSKRLINELEITSTFNQDFVEKVESNIENKDALIDIITESFYDTYNVLNEKGEDRLSLLVVAGSWIEGVYITTQIALSTGYNENFVNIIASQKAPLEELVRLMEEHSDNEDINAVLPQLRYIQEVYNRVGEELTQEQIDDIAKNIEDTRNEIVS